MDDSDCSALAVVLFTIAVAVVIVLGVAAVTNTLHMDAVCEAFGYEDILRYDDEELCIGRIDDAIVIRPLEELKAEVAR